MSRPFPLTYFYSAACIMARDICETHITAKTDDTVNLVARLIVKVLVASKSVS